MAWKSMIPRVAHALEAAVPAAVDDTGQHMEAVALAHARVRTGFMRDHLTWDAETRELRGEAPWTIYNELGTRHTPAQPMLAPAAEAGRQHVGEAAREELRKRLP